MIYRADLSSIQHEGVIAPIRIHSAGRLIILPIMAISEASAGVHWEPKPYRTAPEAAMSLLRDA